MVTTEPRNERASTSETCVSVRAVLSIAPFIILFIFNSLRVFELDVRGTFDGGLSALLLSHTPLSR